MKKKEIKFDDWAKYLGDTCDKLQEAGKERMLREEQHEAKKRVVACIKACEGFDDPMELRQQRDFAVRALHNLMAHQPKPDNPSVEWLAYYDFLDSIDIVVD